MINILVATHGNMAESLLHSAKMLIGEPENVDFVFFREEMDID